MSYSDDYDEIGGEDSISFEIDKQTYLYPDDTNDDMLDVHINKLLQEDLYDIFKSSPFFDMCKDSRRLKREDIQRIYYYFVKEINQKENFINFSESDIFMQIADFFDINYRLLYDSLLCGDKLKILEEMQSKTKVNIKKLNQSKTLF